VSKFCTAALIALAGCGGTAPPPAAPAPPTLDGGWRTLRAEHQVTIDAAKEGGGREQRTIRGVIAVARPDKFRLRALGPGGITLFDVLYRGGDIRILHALRDAGPGTPLERIARTMAGDLAAAYQLAPAPVERTARVEPSAIAVSEPGRDVRLTEFRAVDGKSAPTHLLIDNRTANYTVTVRVENLTLDEPLDPALFQPR
jgi:Protein of unknown function (DUF3261)